MAKRKAARTVTKTPARRPGAAAGRKAAKRAGGAGARKGRSTSAKTAASARTAGKTKKAPGRGKKATRPAAKSARKAVRKAPKTVAVKRTVARTPNAARPPAKPASKAARPAPRAPAAARKAAKTPAPPPRKAPSLDRQRRILDEDIVRASPPSSLDMNRSASAVRTGRRELKERYDEHTETSPALTAGDVDADWESAYSVGDEAPGGDNPTPDQDIVDDIGRAVGIEYQDNEELKGADKVEKRDRNRWELDPASSDDWDDRD